MLKIQYWTRMVTQSHTSLGFWWRCFPLLKFNCIISRESCINSFSVFHWLRCRKKEKQMPYFLKENWFIFIAIENQHCRGWRNIGQQPGESYDRAQRFYSSRKVKMGRHFVSGLTSTTYKRILYIVCHPSLLLLQLMLSSLCQIWESILLLLE